MFSNSYVLAAKEGDNTFSAFAKALSLWKGLFWRNRAAQSNKMTGNQQVTIEKQQNTSQNLKITISNTGNHKNKIYLFLYFYGYPNSGDIIA